MAPDGDVLALGALNQLGVSGQVAHSPHLTQHSVLFTPVTARAEQVERPPLRWVALWSPPETMSCSLFAASATAPILGCTGEPAVPGATEGAAPAWHTGTTTTTLRRSDGPKAGARLDDLAATLARGRTRRPREQVQAEISGICRDTWARRVIRWELTGDTPTEHRLSWHIDTRARTKLTGEVFGKRILITDRDDWPIPEVVAAYRSQSDAEFGFRQLKDPHLVSFSPMHHWTDHNIRVHVFTCVLALQIAHLMRRRAEHAGMHLSVRELLDHLTGIQETVLIYPSTGGRPKARRMLTETSPDQTQLIDIFNLQHWAPPS